MFRSAEGKTDILCSPVSSEIIKLRFNTSVRGDLNSLTEVNNFQRYTTGGLTIADAIRSGERNFKDLFLLLSMASRFKGWLTKDEFSLSLIQEYIDALQKESWVQSAPSKVLRWAFLTLSVFSATPVGIALSFLDTFILDTFSKGWRPNQFVNGPLKDFVKP